MARRLRWPWPKLSRNSRATSWIKGNERKKTTLKHAFSAVPETEASNATELRDATFASLEGHPCTEAAQALTEAVNEQVLHLLAHTEFFGERKARAALSLRRCKG